MPPLVQHRIPNRASITISRDDRQLAMRRLIFLLVSLAAMVADFLPVLHLGSKSFITIHDNLDGEFVVYYLLVKTGKALVFSGATPIANIMNGLPRAALP